jgi:hypothetical protein
MLTDESIVMALNLYLQELGKDITAQKVAEWFEKPEVREKHGITKSITERTARRYLHILGYRFHPAPKGMYGDGHERPDVVYYRDKDYIPWWAALQYRMMKWDKDGNPEYGPYGPGRRVVIWFHDETIFYAHDRRRRSWYHIKAAAKPYAKGDGPSFMVADYISAQFGWLRSPDGERNARRVLRPGKNRDGYFTCDEIVEQAEAAMDLVSECYPDFEHVFVYDNATTHSKRPKGALSARKMTKNPSSNFHVQVNQRDENGKLVYNPDGTLVKIKVNMTDATFNGQPQALYFPEDHPRAGEFKGMVTILEERGFTPEFIKKRKAECKNFKCQDNSSTSDCCLRRTLFNQPDFAHVDSLLEEACRARGFQVKFLPKFHCELNFIEQCWGYAKHIYRLNPESSREDALQTYGLEALESVPLQKMHRYVLLCLFASDVLTGPIHQLCQSH